MTKEELEQYRSIVAEIDEIRDRLNSHTVHGTVTGSDSEFPYVQHVMPVGGVTETEANQRDMLLIRRLERQKKDIIGRSTIIMTKKQLQKFRKLQIDLESIQNQIAKLDAQIKKVTPSYGMTPRGGKSPDKEDKIIKLIKLKKDYEIRGGKIIAEQMEIEQALQKLSNPVEEAVLRYRYIDNMNWEDISSMIHYSISKIYSIHRLALKNISEIKSV